MQNVFDILKERGLIAQTTHEEEIRRILGEEKTTCHIPIYCRREKRAKEDICTKKSQRYDGCSD